jgi:hypothetical protein
VVRASIEHRCPGRASEQRLDLALVRSRSPILGNRKLLRRFAADSGRMGKPEVILLGWQIVPDNTLALTTPPPYPYREIDLLDLGKNSRPQNTGQVAQNQRAVYFCTFS